MTELNKCTCVKVNKEKMDLIKSKGLHLQDILDKAMDEELQLSKISNSQQKIEELKEIIKKLEQEKEDSLKEYDKKIDLIIKLLTESKNTEETYYNKRIQSLKMEIEYLEKK